MTEPSTAADGTLRGLHWSYALLGIADGTLLPFIPLILVGRGLSPAAVGVVLAATAASWFTVGLATAYLADRSISPERMVVLGGVAAAAISLLFFLPGGLTVAVVVVVLTLVRAPFMLLDPIALRRLRHAPRTDYARIRLRTSAGWAVSSIASGVVYQGFGLRLLPLAYAPLALAFGGWVWRSVKPLAAELAVPAATAAKVRRIPAVFGWFLVCCFLLGASLAATQNFLTVQINVLGGGALLVGAAAGFQALAEIPTMAYIHVLTRYLSHRWLFVIGCVIYLVIYVAWALVSSATIAALLKLAGGVAFALTFVSAVLIANELVPSRLRATGQALMKSVMFGVAPILGSLGGGFVYGALGPRVMFLGSTIFVIAAGVVALLVVPAPAMAKAHVAVAPPPEPAPATP